MTAKDSIPHIPSLFLGRQQKSLKVARKKLMLLAKRHEERCEALHYGLGIVHEGDTWRAPAEKLTSKSKKRRSKDSNKSRVEDSAVDVPEVAKEVVHSKEQRPVEPKVEKEDAAPDGEDGQEVGHQH
jgi:hypothetical protein